MSAEGARPPPALAKHRTDPTRTLTLRQRYQQDLVDRYNAVGDVAIEMVRDRDIFNLADDGDPSDLTGQKRAPKQTTPPGVPSPPPYDFPSTAAGVKAFDDWLTNALDAVVLGSASGGPDAAGWTDQYIQHAYFRGATHADVGLRAGGWNPDPFDVEMMFNLPVHRDTLEMFHRRQFDLLDGLNATTSKELSRELSDAFLEGVGPDEAARRIENRLAAVTLVRARTIARTEIIHAHAESTLNRYQSFLGPNAQVTALVEFQTAGDRRVCTECEDLEGEIYSLKDARGVIPVHPNCRCVWLPVVDTMVDPSGTTVPVTPGIPDLERPPTRPGFDDTTDVPFFPTQQEAADRYARAITKRPASATGTRGEQLADELGEDSLDDLLDRLDAKVAEMVNPDAVDPNIRVNPWSSRAILRDGRFKSQFEVGDSYGTYNPDMRAEFERVMWGYSDDIPDADRPIYGFLSQRGRDETRDQARQYGSIVWELNEEVLQRATFTMDDSLIGGSTDWWHLARPVTAPDYRAARVSRYDYREILEARDLADVVGRGYVEAQYHGGVGLDDVKSLVWRPWEGGYDITDEDHIDEVVALARDARGRGIPLRAELPDSEEARAVVDRLTEEGITVELFVPTME